MRWTHAIPRISLIRFLLTGEFSQICKEFSFCISNLDQSFVLCFWPTFGAPCKFPVESIVELLHRQLPVLLCRLNSRCFVGEHRNQIKISYWKCKYLFPSPPGSLPPWRVAAKLCVPSVGEVRALWSACPRLPSLPPPLKNGKLFETCSETGSSKLTPPFCPSAAAPLHLLPHCPCCCSLDHDEVAAAADSVAHTHTGHICSVWSAASPALTAAAATFYFWLES